MDQEYEIMLKTIGCDSHRHKRDSDATKRPTRRVSPSGSHIIEDQLQGEEAYVVEIQKVHPLSTETSALPGGIVVLDEALPEESPGGLSGAQESTVEKMFHSETPHSGIPVIPQDKRSPVNRPTISMNPWQR